MATLAGNGYVLLGLAERYATCVVDVGSERSSSGAECGSGTIFFSGRRCLFLVEERMVWKLSLAMAA